MAKYPNRPVVGRFARNGAVVAERRTLTGAYLHPDDHNYEHGDRLFVPPASSEARDKHRANSAARKRMLARIEARKTARRAAAKVAS